MLFPKPVRIQDEKYKSWIREQPCVNCQNPFDVNAHHEPPDGGGGKGTKVGDNRCLPLCGAKCHRQRHDHGKKTFWNGRDYEALILHFNAAYETMTGRKIGEKPTRRGK